VAPPLRSAQPSGKAISAARLAWLALPIGERCCEAGVHIEQVCFFKRCGVVRRIAISIGPAQTQRAY
jgi:hypothetical protein